MSEFRTSPAGDVPGVRLKQQTLSAELRAATVQRPGGETPVRRRALFAAILTALFVSAVVGLQFLPWQGNRELHTNMEVVATLLAAIVGVLALVRFYSRKSSVYLFLATGFTGTALLDGYHAVVTSGLIDYVMPSPPESLIPWSWNASRTFLAFLMTLMWGASRWEQKKGESGRLSEGIVYLAVGSLALASFLFFACTPLPRAYYPEYFFGRPEEFVAAVFFVIAMCGFASQTALRKDSFETWLVWSLLVGFVAQTFAMSRSYVLFDMPFDLAHLLKIFSYLLVLVGLLIDVHRLFCQAEEAHIALRQQADELKHLTLDQQDALDRHTETLQRLESAHEKLHRARESAELATRSKSEFLANMSHEIRTPMTAILGFADILEESNDPAAVDNAVQTIRSNAKHLLAIINDILDMSKIETGKMHVEQIPLSPVQIVRDAVSLMQPRAEGKGVEMLVTYDRSIPAQIVSDPTRIRQILLNLLGNAVKFTEFGSITLHVSAEPEKQLLRLSIVDTGVGMTPEQRERITRFEAFNQADGSTTRKFGGSGLGLRISSSLVRLLGGEILVESESGKGSTFTATVGTGDLRGVRMLSPAECREEGKPGVSSADKPIQKWNGKPLEGLRLLLAEDGPDNQRLVSHILKKAGADVVIAGNGRIAVEKVQAAEISGQFFDVILMDIQMPELDGYGAMRQLRGSGYTRPIIALTAHAMAKDRQMCLDAGCNDFATKPIDRTRLISTIRKHSVCRKRKTLAPELTSDMLAGW